MRAAPVSPHSAPFWALYLYQTHDISPYQTRYTATDVGNLYINSGTLYQPGHTLLHFGHTMPMRAHCTIPGTAQINLFTCFGAVCGILALLNFLQRPYETYSASIWFQSVPCGGKVQNV